MICPYLNKECVYDEWSDHCTSHCKHITIEEIEHQKEMKKMKENPDIEELVKNPDFNKMAVDPEYDKIIKEINTPVNNWVEIESDDFIITYSGIVLLKNQDETKYLVAEYVFTPPLFSYNGEVLENWKTDFYNIESGEPYSYEWICENYSHMCLIKII